MLQRIWFRPSLPLRMLMITVFQARLCYSDDCTDHGALWLTQLWAHRSGSVLAVSQLRWRCAFPDLPCHAFCLHWFISSNPFKSVMRKCPKLQEPLSHLQERIKGIKGMTTGKLAADLVLDWGGGGGGVTENCQATSMQFSRWCSVQLALVQESDRMRSWSKM